MRCFQITAFFFAASLFIPAARSQKTPLQIPPIDHFEIGRQFFFDFGPPFHYFEIFLVRSADSGSSVKRISLTPPGDACLSPAQIESGSTTLDAQVSDLLGNSNPCSIPEKELRRERKRCKGCLVFSGANVTMRVPCGTRTRLIRADVLDRDMFDAVPNTPEHTSWTMQLLDRLASTLGPGVLDKPAFYSPTGDRKPAVPVEPEILGGLESGAYDNLFPKSDEKPSSIYRATQIPLAQPTVKLLTSSPFAPQDPALPKYPPLPRFARVQGPVSFTLVPDTAGNPGSLSFVSGNPLLQGVVREVASTWKFPKAAAGQTISATIEFALNCPTAPK
ncbi:MAG TPA: hypothetical protein VGR03_04030 [Candidatus Acidoferrum sp.]|nr:hypothetical protein [Candidatus Acidoferrum sp.]